jgi:hypothetical protein
MEGIIVDKLSQLDFIFCLVDDQSTGIVGAWPCCQEVARFQQFREMLPMGGTYLGDLLGTANVVVKNSVDHDRLNN